MSTPGPPASPVARSQVRVWLATLATLATLGMVALTASCTASPQRQGLGVELTLEALVARFSIEPRSEDAQAIVALVHASGDARYAAHLLDLVRIGYSSLAAEAALDGLARLSGIPRRSQSVHDYLTYGSWVLEEAPAPAPGYAGFKAALYRQVDNDFVPLLNQVRDLRLLAALQWGGVAVGAIQELNDPARIPLGAAAWSMPEEMVFGLVDAAGEAVAYPERILARHELANDRLGGVPVSVSFCSLCRAARLFDRRVGGITLTLRTSGLLYNSNKVMVDNETSTLWQQLDGKALAGPLLGHQLVELPVQTTSWGEWQRLHPASEVVDLPAPTVIDGETGVPIGYDYRPGLALADYVSSEVLWYPVLQTPNVLALKETVATLSLDGSHLAVSVAALAAAPGPQRLRLGTRSLLARAVPFGIEFEDAGTGERLVSGQSLWFAWYGLHPDTEVWPPA